jgi:hypothetical protein
VIFFSVREDVIRLFDLWHELYLIHQEEHPHDQSMLALAMEKLNFNPYTLSYNYNYRGFGDPISGVVASGIRIIRCRAKSMPSRQHGLGE